MDVKLPFLLFPFWGASKVLRNQYVKGPHILKIPPKNWSGEPELASQFLSESRNHCVNITFRHFVFKANLADVHTFQIFFDDRCLGFPELFQAGSNSVPLSNQGGDLVSSFG